MAVRRIKMLNADLVHLQLGTSHLVNVGSCPRHSQITFGRAGGLGVAAAATKWGSTQLVSLGYGKIWSNVAKEGMSGVNVRCDY